MAPSKLKARHLSGFFFWLFAGHMIFERNLDTKKGPIGPFVIS